MEDALAPSNWRAVCVNKNGCIGSDGITIKINYVDTRVGPDTEFAGYPANNFAGYQISGAMPSAVYFCIIRQGHHLILLKAARYS